MKIFSLRFNREDAAARITSSPLPDQGTLQAKEKWGEFAKFENCHHLACCFPLPWPFCNFTMIICKCGRKRIFWGKTKKCWNVAGCVRHCAADKQTQQQPGQSVLFPLPPFISALTYFPLCLQGSRQLKKNSGFKTGTSLKQCVSWSHPHPKCAIRNGHT